MTTSSWGLWGPQTISGRDAIRVFAQPDVRLSPLNCAAIEHLSLYIVCTAGVHVYHLSTVSHPFTEFLFVLPKLPPKHLQLKPLQSHKQVPNNTRPPIVLPSSAVNLNIGQKCGHSPLVRLLYAGVTIVLAAYLQVGLAMEGNVCHAGYIRYQSNHCICDFSIKQYFRSIKTITCFVLPHTG